MQATSRFSGLLIAAVAGALGAATACSSGDTPPANDPGMTPVPTSTVTGTTTGPDLFDVAIARATEEERMLFNDGDQLFNVPLRDADGLGPLYTRASCGACHGEGLRGPGAVEKMTVITPDGVTPSVDQTPLAYGHTVHPLFTAGAKSAVLPPMSTASITIKVTTRVGPTILGRGYVEAVLDSEIERVAAEQAARTDGIHGRVNHVVYASEPNTDKRFHQHQKGDALIGRFGFKARIGTLDDFAADALQGDMGITSPLRPTEVANPDGLTDDLKPGVDVTYDSVNTRAMYVRLTAIPIRKAVANGDKLFAQAKCSVCHAPSLKTRADYPIAGIANMDAPLYSDLLLHDMGNGLADGINDGEATSRDWRTPPLIGLRFTRTFLHDGRAASIEQAISLHGSAGSEAIESVTLFNALSDADRATLLSFVGAL